MSVARTVAEVLAEHVTLEIEGIDRLYLNVYVPRLQHVGGMATAGPYSVTYTVVAPRCWNER